MKTYLLVFFLFAQSLGLSAMNDTFISGEEPSSVSESLIAQKKLIENKLTSKDYFVSSKTQGKLMYEFHANGTATTYLMKSTGSIVLNQKFWKITEVKKTLTLNIVDQKNKLEDNYLISLVGGNLVLVEDFTNKECVLYGSDQLLETDLELMKMDLVGAWKMSCEQKNDITIIINKNGTFQKIVDRNITNGTWAISQNGQFISFSTPKSQSTKRILDIDSSYFSMKSFVQDDSCTASNTMKFKKLNEKESL